MCQRQGPYGAVFVEGRGLSPAGNVDPSQQNFEILPLCCFILHGSYNILPFCLIPAMVPEVVMFERKGHYVG